MDNSVAAVMKWSQTVEAVAAIQQRHFAHWELRRRAWVVEGLGTLAELWRRTPDRRRGTAERRSRYWNRTMQVCVQLPTSAANVALPAFAAVRRAAAPCCCGAGHTAANLPHAAAGGKWNRQTDERTDTVPLRRPYTIQAVPTKRLRGCKLR